MWKYLLFIFFSISTNAQYPKNYLDTPIKIPIVFAGTFGELRSNHFHSGIDIKTQQKEGIPIYAPADGYISRIKVKQYGYGKALYMNHPNGYTTVYGHLQRYNDSIQKYVKSIQYATKNYALDEYLKKDKFTFKKGDLIGYTGDTGSSGGAHLHYEVRDTKTQKVINPMLFGLTTTDTKAPVIRKLMGIPLNKTSHVNNSSFKTLIPIRKVAENIYQADTIEASGLIGFALNVYDNQDLASNKNGIYSLEMKVNGETIYFHDLESFSFAESKYINLLIDYEYYGNYKVKMQKTHKVDNNPLSIYKRLINDGKFVVRPNHTYTIEIIARDFHGNKSTLSVPITGNQPLTAPESEEYIYKLFKDEFTKYQIDNVTIAFPKKAVYEDTAIDFRVSNDTAYVHKPTIPLDRNYTLTFYTDHLSDFQKKKVYIANIKNNRSYYVRTKKKDRKVYTTTKSFGTYTLKYDDEAPIVSFYNFKNNQNLAHLKKLKIKIKDEESGIEDFYATIDDKWILVEYNHKKGILTYDFSDLKLPLDTKHIFKIIVTDKLGNITEKSAVFYR